MTEPSEPTIETPPASAEPPPADVPVAAPEALPAPVAEEVPAKPKGPSLFERLGAPFARLRYVQGTPVVALAVATFALFVIGVLLALMVFSPSVAPFRLGSTKAGYLAQRDLAIEKVAVRFAHDLLTFDYRTVESDLNRLQSHSTGNFVKQLKEVRGSKQVIDALKNQQASSTGTVRGASVESVHGDTATVRVFLARTVRNKGLKEPRTTLENVELTLVRTSGGWKVDNVG
jgi:Mce-associated membrane protein